MVDDSSLPPPPPPPSSPLPPPPPPPPPPARRTDAVQDAVDDVVDDAPSRRADARPAAPTGGRSPYSRPVSTPDSPGGLRGRGGGRVPLLIGLLLTLAALAGISLSWPADAEPAPVDPSAPTSTLMSAEAAQELPPPASSGGSGLDGLPYLPEAAVPADLFGDGPAAAVAEVLQASGGPEQLLEVTIYPDYLFVAYRPPGTDVIDSRQWRGRVAPATPNLIDDRVDESTTPALFTLAELGSALDLLPTMVADAPSRYGLPVEVTHVIVDRFLPFDQRVLVRVYTTPSDGRSGGGYVTYATDGTFQKVCC